MWEGGGGIWSPDRRDSGGVEGKQEGDGYTSCKGIGGCVDGA